MKRQPRVGALRSWIRTGAIALAAFITLTGCITIAPLPVEQTPAPQVPTPVATISRTQPPIPTPTLTPAAETPVATPAATPAPTLDPTSEQALLLSMLETVDVDPLAETSGVRVGTEAVDLPAFAAQGGLRRAAQTIDVGTDLTVYDFRYQFPTATAAAAFLDAEADGLGETHAGAVESEPALQMGDDTRYYTAHTEIFVIQDSFNYLIRVENVVAKIWMGGDPGAITAEEALGVASAASARMTVVFDPSEIEGARQP